MNAKSLIFLLAALVSFQSVVANDENELLYNQLAKVSKGPEAVELFASLQANGQALNWDKAEEKKFEGHLRLLRINNEAKNGLYLIRNLDGTIYLLSRAAQNEGDGVVASDDQLNDQLENKLSFHIKTITTDVNGVKYRYARLVAVPLQLAFDRIFKISIVLMLFFVMVGMGLTLKVTDFATVLKKPRGILVGEITQFVVMPAAIFGLAHLMGFYESYPFVFVGMMLVAATPGGATSNLMTYFAKGDLALSISLTSLSTALSLILTPLILALYCANIPDVQMPYKMIFLSILILVLIPLLIGMAVLHKWPTFANKATPFFSALGVLALLFIIIAGVISNLHVFSDTDRYGLAFYSMVFILTFVGMMIGVIVPKLSGIDNYQTRAISIEIGIRNSSLGMVIALLIQDAMGDFHSSMFVTSGMFGLMMYIAGVLAIQVYKFALPVKDHGISAKIKTNRS